MLIQILRKMKTYNVYDSEKLIDRTWYDSSTILYSECYDKVDSLKELKIYFKSGRVYLYKDVDVNDYLLFREAKSQGQSIGKYITKKVDKKPFYECNRLEDIDVSLIEEWKERYTDTTFVDLKEKEITIYKDEENVLYKNDKVTLGEEEQQLIIDILSLFNIKFKIKGYE